MFLTGGCILPSYDHCSWEIESWRAILGAYITDFGNGILPPMSHRSELVMWLQSNCKRVWEMGESTRLLSETVMSRLQMEKMKGISQRQISVISVKVVNIRGSSLLIASLKVGIFSLILTCILVLLIERMTSLCRESQCQQNRSTPLAQNLLLQLLLEISLSVSLRMIQGDQLHFLFLLCLVLPSQVFEKTSSKTN